MAEQEVKPKRKLVKKRKGAEPTLDLGGAFDPATAKENDFDLDLDAAKFQGKKGQAGTRTKSPREPEYPLP